MSESASVLLGQLGEALLSDLDLGGRSLSRTPDTDPNRLSTASLPFAASLRTVYTAFDGDHFHLCGAMRQHVLQIGCVPANPESILGYKDTVSARHYKKQVLYDDLSVLRWCDELWVYTDLDPTLESLEDLAEGVLVELLFYLKRTPHPRVRFVSISGLIRGEKPGCRPFEFSYSQCKLALLDDQRDGVLSLANSGQTTDQTLRAVEFHITDPLDFKYAHWLRAGGYGEKKVPLVPGLAIDLTDCGYGREAVGQVFLGWIRLSYLCSRACMLPPVDGDRSPSLTVAILELAWRKVHNSASPPKPKSWHEYGIPKILAGEGWPLTKREGGLR